MFRYVDSSATVNDDKKYEHELVKRVTDEIEKFHSQVIVDADYPYMSVTLVDNGDLTRELTVKMDSLSYDMRNIEKDVNRVVARARKLKSKML